MSEFIHKPFFRFSYVTSSSLNSPGEPPINCTFFLCNDSRISSLGTEWKAAVDLKMPCVLIFHRQFTFWEIVRFHALSGYVDIPDKSIIPYRASWLRGNARDSYSGGPGFESQCRPTWLGFFRGFPQSSRQILRWIFITTIHLTIIHQIHIS